MASIDILWCCSSFLVLVRQCIPDSKDYEELLLNDSTSPSVDNLQQSESWVFFCPSSWVDISFLTPFFQMQRFFPCILRAACFTPLCQWLILLFQKYNTGAFEWNFLPFLHESPLPWAQVRGSLPCLTLSPVFLIIISWDLWRKCCRLACIIFVLFSS